MSEPDSIVSAQLEHLLAVVNSHRDESCNRIRSQAHQQGDEIIRQAYREARQRLHQNVQDGRQQMERSIASARAKQKTEERLCRQQADREFLDAAWGQLHDTLISRWQSPDSRMLWVDMVFRQASDVLLEKHWLVEHPTDWPDAEKSLFSKRVLEYTGSVPDMQSANDVRAGIRITLGGACVDGSLSGLLVDRLRIDSELLSQGGE